MVPFCHTANSSYEYEGPVTKLTDLIVFNDKQLAARYAAGKIPMATLLEAYLDGAIDIPNMDAFLDARRDLVNFSLTKKHFEFFFTRMIPEVAIHSKSQDKRIVREHYDRGDDFFAALLGETMIYTAGIFIDPAESLEQAQKNKMDLVCRKLMIEPGHELLDVGCGWGDARGPRRPALRRTLDGGDGDPRVVASPQTLVRVPPSATDDVVLAGPHRRGIRGSTLRRGVRQSAQEQLTIGRRVPDPVIVAGNAAHVDEHLDSPLVGIRKHGQVAGFREFGRGGQCMYRRSERAGLRGAASQVAGAAVADRQSDEPRQGSSPSPVSSHLR